LLTSLIRGYCIEISTKFMGNHLQCVITPML
jgi:hypothetical protein